MSEHKAILFLGNYPPPYGGVPRHLEYLAPFLAQRGWDVHVLSSGSTGIQRTPGLTIYKPTWLKRQWSHLAASLSVRKFMPPELASIQRTSPQDWRRYLDYTYMAERIIKQHTIKIVSAYNMYSYAPIAALLSQRNHIPAVVTNFGEFYSHRQFFERHPQTAPYVIQHCAHLLAMSQHCADSYTEIGLQPAVTVIPYGVDINMFTPKNDARIIRDRFQYQAEDCVVLFLGRLTRDMGLHTFLEVATQLQEQNKRIKFLIAGQKGDLLEQAQALARRYPKTVTVVASVPFNELPLFYAAADIVIAPTQGQRACGSLAAIEAMATGKPVIAAQIGGIPEIVMHLETGLLVEVEQPTQLATAIITLSANPSERSAMGAKGRKRVVDLFDETKLDQRIENIFLQSIEDARGS